MSSERKHASNLVAKALRYAGHLEWARTETTDLYELADEVIQWGEEDPSEPMFDICCPVCQEMECDSDCPLASFRNEQPLCHVLISQDELVKLRATKAAWDEKFDESRGGMTVKMQTERGYMAHLLDKHRARLSVEETGEEK